MKSALAVVSVTIFCFFVYKQEVKLEPEPELISDVVADPVTTTSESEEEGYEEVHRQVDTIVIHHSATSAGNAESFRRFHMEEKGWQDIGYHYVVTNGSGGPDGEIQIGRHESVQGAHAKNRNENSIGICLVGDVRFTDRQIEVLVDLLVDICKRYNIAPSTETIQEHHEECPGTLDLVSLIREVRVSLEP